MKLKIKILAISIISCTLFVNSLKSQIPEPWQIATPINISPIGGLSSTFPTYEMIADNYGLHIIGLTAGTMSQTNGGDLNYFLVDNDGNTLESQTNIESNVTGFCIGSFKGRVYVAVCKSSSIKIYERIDGHSNLQIKFTFQPLINPTNVGGLLNMDMAITDNKVHIIWNPRPQLGPGGTAIGYAVYNYSTNTLQGEYSSPNDEGALFPQLTSSSNHVSLIYTRYYNSTTQDCFKNIDISLDNPPVYGQNLIVNNFGINSNSSEYTKANIIEKNNIKYSFAKLFVNSLGLTLYSKFKVNANGNWGSNAFQNENFIGEKMYPSLIYNNDNGNIGFVYNTVSTLKYREYDVSQSGLSEPTSILTLTNGGIYTELISNSSHSDFVLYNRNPPNTNFGIVRRPQRFNGNISYNTLLTGIEYINKVGASFTHANGSQMIAKSGSDTKILDNTDFYIDGGGSLTLNTGSLLEVGNNCNIFVDGANSTFTLQPGANIVLGTNAKITVRNGGRINAQNITFNTTTQPTWQGIEIINSVNNSDISGCTFNNATTSIKINNSSMMNYSGSIQNNTFNIPAGGYGIVGNNVSNLNLTGNVFNEGSVGFYIRNTVNSLYESAGNSNNVPVENINVIRNQFHGQNASVIIAGFTSAQTNIYVTNNVFTGIGSNNGAFNFFGRKVNGIVKNNYFNDYNINKNVFLYQSSVQFYGNTMNALYNNIQNSYQSTSILEPSITEFDELLFEGGGNTLTTYNSGTSSETGNIFSDNAESQFFTDHGRNSFETSYIGNHFMGSFNSSETELFARENCFSPTPPRCSLLNINGDPMTVIWDPNYACSQGDIIGYSVIERGNGILDSIPLRSSYSEPISIEDRLYGQMNDHFDNGNYLDAVITAKHIISDYPSCEYLSEALSRMDKAYNILDTFSNMQQRVILWGDFNLYLENKIVSGNYDSKFCDAMYEMTLECLTNMGEFYDAKLGYDMIAMYNPNPNERLLATWDADALEDLLNGAGGGNGNSINENSYLNLDNQEILRIKNLNQNSIITNKEDLKKLEMISSFENVKPIKETIKLMYQKEVKSNENKKVNIVNGSKILLPQQKDYAAVEIKKQSIRSARKEDKDKLMIEHLMLVGGVKSESVATKENAVIANYSLSQNYPNPFNPTTNIKYSLPKSGLVSIKVYDIVGRMMNELVNEVKEQGNYSVSFDGSALASGIYFYRINAGDFVQTKRMVLVK